MERKWIGDKKFFNELRFIVIPIMLQFLIQNFINLLDNIMVGSMGKEAIASITIANQYYILFFPIVTSITTGAAIFTAQYYGAKKFDKLKAVFGFKIIVPMFVTLFFVIVGSLFSKNIISFFESDNELTINYGITYLNIAIYSFIPYTLSAAFSITFRRIKKPIIPMFISSAAMLVNLTLNYSLIYGNFGFPELGIKGAAIATLIARMFEMILFIIIFLKYDHSFKGKINEHLAFSKSMVSEIIKRVIPLILNEFLFTLAGLIIFKSYSNHGTDSITVVSIANTVGNIFFILINGLGSATSVLVGNELGADNKDNALKHSYWLLGYGVIMAILITIFMIPASFIIPKFYNIDISLQNQVTIAIIIRGLVPVPMVITRIIFFILKSGGRTVDVILIDGVFMWLVKVPLALIGSYIFDLNILWLYFIIEFQQFANLIISVYFFKKRKWLINLTYVE